MRFTDIDINFDIRYEGHQNCLKILSMNILSVFSDHHLWRQNWRQYLWTSLCQFNFFVNLFHSLGVSFFDIWHLFDNLTSFWQLDIFLTTWHLFDILGANCPWAPFPHVAHTPVPHCPCIPLPTWPIPLVPHTPCAPIAHVSHTPVPYTPSGPHCPYAPYPYPIAHVTHCQCGPYPLYPITQIPYPCTPLPTPLVPHTLCGTIAYVPLLPLCPIPPVPPLPIGPMAHVAYTPCTPYPMYTIAPRAPLAITPVPHW